MNQVGCITNGEVAKACFVDVGKVNRVMSVKDTTAGLGDKGLLGAIDTQRRSIGILFETPNDVDLGRKGIGKEKKDRENGVHLELVVDEIGTDEMI